MGIADRDWYRDELRRREPSTNPSPPGARPFLPPRDGPLWVATWVLIFVVAIVGSLGSRNWWRAAHAPSSVSQGSIPFTQPAQPRQNSVLQSQGAEPQAGTTVRLPPETRVVSRYVVNGTVTYSEAAGCWVGAASIQVRPSESQLEGGLTPYQVDMLRSADARIARDEAAVRANMAAQSSTTLNRHSECAALDETIRALDARSRHLLSGSEQDFIRAERTQARSRQFQLHC